MISRLRVPTGSHSVTLRYPNRVEASDNVLFVLRARACVALLVFDVITV